MGNQVLRHPKPYVRFMLARVPSYLSYERSCGLAVRANPKNRQTRLAAAASNGSLEWGDGRDRDRRNGFADQGCPGSRMTAMPGSTPQWTFVLREKRDVLAVRQRARQVAHLLQFSPLEQACIAAGVFMIADQARRAFSVAEICFRLEDRQLTVSARPTADSLSKAETSVMEASRCTWREHRRNRRRTSPG